jgi:hypothetical protein
VAAAAPLYHFHTRMSIYLYINKCVCESMNTTFSLRFPAFLRAQMPDGILLIHIINNTLHIAPKKDNNDGCGTSIFHAYTHTSLGGANRINNNRPAVIFGVENRKKDTRRPRAKCAIWIL